MELIIKIDDKDKKICEQYVNGKLGDELGDYVNITELADAIANGIPCDPKGDLISRSELKRVLGDPLYRSTIKDYGEILKYTFVMDCIDDAPTLIVTERQQGEWIIVKDEKWGDNVKCPFCGKELAGTDLNFCCKCGAKLTGSEKMNGGKEE